MKRTKASVLRSDAGVVTRRSSIIFCTVAGNSLKLATKAIEALHDAKARAGGDVVVGTWWFMVGGSLYRLDVVKLSRFERVRTSVRDF
jgi:hypothetical protein